MKKKPHGLFQLQFPSCPNDEFPPKRQTQNAKNKGERRRLAQLQELENTIAALEKDLANLSAQLESPLVSASEVVKISKEYERVQKEMDDEIGGVGRVARMMFAIIAHEELQ